MKLKDFMDVGKLQEIQDEFSKATGLAAIAVDSDGNYLTEGSNFTTFCMECVRKSPEGKRRCEKCDQEEKGVYYCHAGLMDFAADIVVNGEKLGSIIGGQVLAKEPDEEYIRKVAGELNIDPDRLVAEVHKVPVRDEEAIRAAASLLAKIVNNMVKNEYDRKLLNTDRMAIMDEELKKSTQLIGTIQAKTKELESIASKQNILALNSSIEAARAGVAGAGFAVLANETGALSKRSAGIYKEITDSVKSISESIYRMNEAGK
ncbi:MAG: PocR ligand-binding domain-containing protein [Clostridiales bacterium]|nr:PocR ligand-binding domain-containing protein [Clostridiales bacterium]